MLALQKWSKDNDVCFIGSFVSFKGKDCNIKEDRIVGFGDKKTIKCMIDGIKDEVKQEKSDFINW